MMPSPRPDGAEHKTGAVRIIVTDEAARAFAQLKAERRVVTLTPASNGRPATTTTRAVPDREVYELVISAFLDRERGGEAVTILYPPESARRRTVWIDSAIKSELEAAAKRLDVSVGALFFTATQALLSQDRNTADLFTAESRRERAAS
jgi:hypothetical protein